MYPAEDLEHSSLIGAQCTTTLEHQNALLDSFGLFHRTGLLGHGRIFKATSHKYDSNVFSDPGKDTYSANFPGRITELQQIDHAPLAWKCQYATSQSEVTAQIGEF